MTPPRQERPETTKTRDLLLDCVERLMVKKGYAAVTYRAVAAAAGVTPGLLQYHFPSLDELFIAVIRRRSEQNVERLTEALLDDPQAPLRVIWEYSQDESMSVLTTEFLALGNRRASIRAEIAEVTERVRRLQLQVLHAHVSQHEVEFRLSSGGVLVPLDGHPEADPPRGGCGGIHDARRSGGSIRELSRRRRARAESLEGEEGKVPTKSKDEKDDEDIEPRFRHLETTEGLTTSVVRCFYEPLDPDLSR